MNTPTREQYEKLFEKYSDVVTLTIFREMLGGISETVTRNLLRGDYVEHFVVNGTYYIPKACVIDYVLSPHYFALSAKLKHHIRVPDLWKNNVFVNEDF